MQGAGLLYRKFILPTLKRHEALIDQYVELGESKMRTSLAQLVRRAICLIQCAGPIEHMYSRGVKDSGTDNIASVCRASACEALPLNTLVRRA